MDATDAGRTGSGCQPEDELASFQEAETETYLQRN